MADPLPQVEAPEALPPPPAADVVEASSVAPEVVVAPPEAPALLDPAVEPGPQPYWNSYAAGIALGLVLLAAFVFTGRGLGASGAVTRMAAYSLQKVEASVRGGTEAETDTIATRNAYTGQYLKGPADPLDDFLVYMFVGVVVGGFVSGVLARRASFSVTHGPNSYVGRRLALAALGGFISAYGARLARGCTSGQALTGGATLALGSWVFMLAVFAGGYAIAYFVRREWI